jgi:hypothetical protein
MEASTEWSHESKQQRMQSIRASLEVDDFRMAAKQDLFTIVGKKRAQSKKRTRSAARVVEKHEISITQS